MIKKLIETAEQHPNLAIGLYFIGFVLGILWTLTTHPEVLTR